MSKKSEFLYPFVLVVTYFCLSLFLKVSIKDRHLSLDFFFDLLAGQSSALFIFNQLRLPAILASCAVAILLVIATLILQAISKNDLADPSALGFSTIAMTVLALSYLYIPFFRGMPYWGIVSLSGLSVLLFSLMMYRFAMTGTSELDGNLLLLLGIGVNAFFQMILTYLKTYSGEAKDIIALLMRGNFDQLSLSLSVWILLLSILALLVFLGLLRPFRLLQQDRELAQSLGLSLKVYHVVFFGLMSLCIALSLILGANFPFVAFTAIHVFRPYYARQFGVHLLTSILFMAASVLMSDVLAHQLFETILPTNLFLSLFGGLGFLVVLLQRRGRQW
ncbi:iron chelate uptake ABC transporter family permease subunit [Streptococcus saliviloxodontae]|uniref:Iron complex transport system permease protein n=1 Tax=Streptococcus saliviloxodontae TaxID=1349416 RepID=A0ABS2PK60_9STRE|nr:iron chelate uptake ABC transporter family permease subunit [Streptococcus saliviloxodontae]MBM7635672.1 iron complex transport system permease protein [Streptococcus saliviloxodontae]